MRVNRDLLVSILAFATVSSLTAVVLYSVLGQIVVVSATTSTNAIGGNVVIPNTCIPTVSNQLVSFPSTPAGSFQATANAEKVTNFGNAASNIFVAGGNPVYFSNSFLVDNIVWDDQVHAATINGNALVNGLIGGDTQLVPGANGGSNNIFFGINVPSAANPGTYQTTVNVMLSC